MHFLELFGLLADMFPIVLPKAALSSSGAQSGDHGGAGARRDSSLGACGGGGGSARDVRQHEEERRAARAGTTDGGAQLLRGLARQLLGGRDGGWREDAGAAQVWTAPGLQRAAPGLRGRGRRRGYTWTACGAGAPRDGGQRGSS